MSMSHRPGAREEQPRDFPKSAHAHHAERERLLFCEDREQVAQVASPVGARGNFANVSTGTPRFLDRTLHPRGTRHCAEVVIGTDQLHARFTRGLDGATEPFQRAHFHIEHRGVRQELRKKLRSFRKAQAVRAAFRGMPNGDDQWNFQAASRSEQLTIVTSKCIHT